MTEIYRYSESEWKNFKSKYDYKYTKLVCISNFNILVKKLLNNFMKLMDTVIASDSGNNMAVIKLYNKIKLINLINNELILNECIIIIMDIRETFIKYYKLYINRELELLVFVNNILNEVLLDEKFQHHVRSLCHRYNFFTDLNLSENYKDNPLIKEFNELFKKLDIKIISCIVKILYNLFNNHPDLSEWKYSDNVILFLNSFCYYYNIAISDYTINGNILKKLNGIYLDTDDGADMLYNMRKFYNLIEEEFGILKEDIENFFSVLYSSSYIKNTYNHSKCVINDMIIDLRNLIDVCEKYFYL